MLIRTLVPLFLLIVQALDCTTAQWRSISEISYTFTTCNTTGLYGPTNTSCLNQYNTQLTETLNTSPEEQGFNGGQGFEFPRSGRYNITVAGAAGGRGLCNTKTSKGAILKRQLMIVKDINDTVLILVGQKGVSPCSRNPNYYLCQSPPKNITEANQCLQEWMTNGRVSSNHGDRLGGGAGGGASMIWPQDATGEFVANVLPYLIAAGGGGTSLATDYGSILGTHLGFDITALKMTNETNEEFYQRWIDARSNDSDNFPSGNFVPGYNGNRPNIIGEGATTAVSGGGGGWRGSNMHAAIDGQLLSTSNNFSRGGLNCITGFGYNESSVTFPSINGGFGGGGGACTEGGGGGGYGGGLVLRTGDNIPGGGGYSYLGEDGVFIGYNDDEDGYVQIVPADCNCQYGCIADESGLMYQCTCPQDLELASNGIDCISRKSNVSFTIAAVESVHEYFSDAVEIHSSLVRFFTVQEIYGISVKLSVENSSSVVNRQSNSAEKSPCIVVWLNQSLVPVLISQSSSRNGTQLDHLRIIQNAKTGNISNSSLDSLDDPQLIAAGIILGSENCTVENITLYVATTTTNIATPNNISIQTIFNEYNATFQSVISDISIAAMSTTTTSTFLQTSTQTYTTSLDILVTSTPPPTNISSQDSTYNIIIIAVPVAGGIVLIIALLIFVFVLCVIIKRRRSNSIKRVYQIHTKASMDDLTGDDRFQLQKLRYRLATLKANPNYGEQLINNDDEVDLGKSKADVENGYAAITFERSSESLERRGTPHRIRSRSRRRTFTLRPKYGIMSPVVDFYQHNSTRPEDDNWEYDRTQLTYLRDIGEGQFGKVLLMKAKNIAGYKGKLPVAVKTLSSIEEEDIKKFLQEVELMKKFANANIVSLLGVSTQSNEGAPLMILEYMPYGDLQSFLVRHKPKPKESTLIGLYYQLRFAGDIANAMAFLESNKYVHRDVAARNCLVGPNLEVKVADFGMARVVQEKDYYRIAGRAVLPVRWMAPESLLYGVFASSSDIWAYGVLLWEIATYGSIPLESNKVQEIVEMAQKETLNHPWPINGPEELMELKEQCHNYDAEKRPTFQDISSILPSSRSLTNAQT